MKNLRKLKTVFFCDQSSPTLHQASTFILDKRVRECAVELQDSVLLAKLSHGDLISLEAVYHRNCLVSLYNKTSQARSLARSKSMCASIAFAELCCYIEDVKTSGDVSVLLI